MLVLLHDGSRVVIRSIVPEDARPLGRMHVGLSEDTVRNRYLSPRPELSRRDLDHLTRVDFVDHVAVVAVDPDRPETLLGVARWIRDPDDPHRAEAAFVVVDRLHGLGLGAVLGIALADLAVERGIQRLSGSMLSGNRASERVFRRMGGEIEVHAQGITSEVTVTLPPESGRLRRMAASRRLRPGRRPDGRPQRAPLRRVA